MAQKGKKTANYEKVVRSMQFQEYIMERYMSKEELDIFRSKYEEGKGAPSFSRKATKRDVQIAKANNDGMTMMDMINTFGVPSEEIFEAIAIAGRSKNVGSK